MKKAPSSVPKGFTLVELLVVIAIIGILSSVILVSLNSSRAKGADVRIISDVQQSRTDLNSGQNGSVYPDLYSATSDADATAGSLTSNGPDVTDLATLAGDASSTDAASGGMGINYVIGTDSDTGDDMTPNATAYAIYGQLVSSSTEYYCMDSVGNTAEATSSNSNITCQ